jgi:hypothetical protein
MNSTIHSHSITDHLAEDFLADNEDSKARLKLAFIAALFATSWIIGSVRMGEVITANSHSVSMIGSLLGF